ncbi:hypothetical protein [Stenotrophomonas maltophilia]|uniref:hypothetical protein n=1 Tax=Stenotrophomonas maltophilia TaxID=40324 RepID=UPI002893CFFA|nr:hypothetical protein [Stenotrophomonas maltophilia]MDT3501767.1 hypothetical protein [Stenotrophomonas maltophilia]
MSSERDGYQMSLLFEREVDRRVSVEKVSNVVQLLPMRVKTKENDAHSQEWVRRQLLERVLNHAESLKRQL